LISQESGKPIMEAVSMELSPTSTSAVLRSLHKEDLKPEKLDIGLYGLLAARPGLFTTVAWSG